MWSVLACVALSTFTGRLARAQSIAGVAAVDVTPATGQFITPAPVDADVPVLRSVMSVDLHDVPLRDALREFARQAGGHLMYDESVVSRAARVTLHATRITLGAALRQALAGTDIKAFVTRGGQVVVLKRVPTAAELQDSATVRGRVVDSATNAPVPQAMVEVDGTKQRVIGNDEGVFLLRDVPAGTHVITAHRLGYKPVRVTVVLEAGADTTIRLALTKVASVLQEVVTTGAGERQKLEVGNSIVTVNADSVMSVTPAATVSQLLANRLPGLLATPGSGAVGAPTRLRIRGLSSIESDNAPIIIVDGIRISNDAKSEVNNSMYAGVVGGTGANNLSSRLDDIDPNTIESIEVMKGPAASTLYGSQAANGVIIIKTKQGHAGPPRWNVYADRRELTQVKDYDYPVQQLGYPLAGGAGPNPNCGIVGISNGSCIPIPGKVLGFNMLRDPRFTPQANGYTQSFGANVSGGNEGLQYFLGGTYLDQLGTAKLPDVNINYIEAGRGGQPLAEETIRPNARTDASATARITGRFLGNSHFAIGTSFMSENQRVGNDGMSGLLTAPRFPTDTSPVAGWDNWYGSRTESLKHVIGDANINWQPKWWGGNVFSGTFTYGWDFSLNDDQYYAARGSCKPLCNGSQDQGLKGYINGGRRSDLEQTLTVGGSVNLPVASWLETQSRFGGNYQKSTTYELYGNASDLGVGRKFYTARGTKFISDIGDEQALAGWYFEEQLNMRRNRLFFTVGLRQDAASSLGETVKPIYAKYNASWVLSEEPFFPFKDHISLFRIRFATGNAGVMPSSTAKLRTYAMQGNYVLDNGSPTGDFAELGSPGNPGLRPEHSREYEGGFEMELFQSRLSLDATWYRKYTWDAIDRGPVAGSLGPAVVRPELLNVGDVVNHGFELGATVRVLDRDPVSYSITGNVTSRSNKLQKIAPGMVTFLSLSASGDLYTGNDSRIVEGYPLFGRWARPILGWNDDDHNGIISPNEVRVGDSLTYVGPTEPKYTAYMSHHLGFLRNRLTVDANFAYSNGMTQFNQLRKSMLSSLAIGQGFGSLKDQACIAAAQQSWPHPSTDWCFMETVKVLRFQDLSVGYMLPQRIAASVGAKSATVRFTASNLTHWSNYHGMDPGINTTPVSGNAVVAGSAFAAPREYGVRVQLQF
ncbi:MAG TPA: TonB-dependent receptor plug domain-containing protein [Gemmatimonadaceae bacterium]|nr:TonB-dependent receptor plug domain-containing protein [Gemmatimonadaceae bacterium]